MCELFVYYTTLSRVCKEFCTARALRTDKKTPLGAYAEGRRMSVDHYDVQPSRKSPSLSGEAKR